MGSAKIGVEIRLVLLLSFLCTGTQSAYCQSKNTIPVVSAPAGCPAGFKNPVVPNGCLGQFRHGTPIFRDAAGDLIVATGLQPVDLTHPGVDLVAPCGAASPIYPVSDGTVEKVINSPSDPSWGVPGKKGLGYAVLVHHSQDTGGKQTYSLYLHMNKPPVVTPGQMVSGGKTRLGLVGETGAAWGCHTHFEIRHFSSFILNDARWSSPPNIYGTGEKRDAPVFLDNWEDPGVFLSNATTPTTLAPVRALESQAGKALSVAWSQDGTLVASGGKDTGITVWAANTGEPLQTLRRDAPGLNARRRGIVSLAFSPDGLLLAGGGDDGGISLWDLQTGKPVKTLSGHTDPVHSVAFTPNGQLLASTSGGSYDYTLRLWSVPTGAALKTVNLSADAHSVAFSGDGRMVAGAAWEQVQVFRLQDMYKMGSFVGGNKYEAANVVVFSPDGKILATAGDEGIIRGWAIASGKSSFMLKGETDRIQALAYSSDGGTLVSGSEKGTIQIWDIKQQRLVGTTRLELGNKVSVVSLSFSGDCRFLAAATTDGAVRLWKIAR